jgi:hypothetical protein
LKMRRLFLRFAQETIIIKAENLDIFHGPVKNMKVTVVDVIIIINLYFTSSVHGPVKTIKF